MARINLPPSTALSPLPPALVSCGTMEKPNLITIAWTGILCSAPPKTYISVRPERYSYNIIKEHGEFVINLPSTAIAKEVDFCGIKSGRDIDKIKETGLTLLPALYVAAPIVAQCPISLECKVDRIIPLGAHDMFIADIVGVSIDENCAGTPRGVDMEKSDLLAYLNGDYFAIGQKIGNFGYSAKK